MFKSGIFMKIAVKTLSYILVAAIASVATIYFVVPNEYSKLEQLEMLIKQQFVGEVDLTAMEDGAAAGMVAALGDRWSYYIPADSYAAHKEQMENAYVGIGVTVPGASSELGYEVLQLEPTGGAIEAGIQIGDVIVEVNGVSVLDTQIDPLQSMIRGEENTTVKVTVLRSEERLEFEVVRKLIEVEVASGTMLQDHIGLVQINNFDERCAAETIAAINALVEQGAQALIFDVRFNPGGYKKELVDVLDYLLPEGVLFRSQLNNGQESVDESNAECLELPMAVLINGDSYSAAEFFAAVLNEYDWAVLVGQPTVGKSYFQSTFQLNDGSAVGLSIGKYFTPNGVSLADVGGLQPEILVEVDQQTAAKIYAGQVDPIDDPQIQAAIAALKDAG